MILGALIGFVGSIIPEVFKLYRDHRDKKHEKEMLELQMRYQREMIEARIEEARALATLELDKAIYSYAEPEVKLTGYKWADMLQVVGAFYNTTVRPTLTYLVIACWLMIKYAGWQILGGSMAVLPTIWTEADNEFVAAVVMFWFGGRAFQRTFRRV